MQVHIITWVHYDHSGQGIVGAWAGLADAEAALAMLDTHGDSGKRFAIESVDVVATQAKAHP